MAKVYQLPLDPTLDNDIVKRLDQLPRARKAEWVRTAIRIYMSIEKGDNVPIVPASVPQSPMRTEKPRRNPKDVEFE
ncbi:hypothetical protein [Brevibacillus nitrificans]|uniref:hypothetical protein n=1 Tax=Brevibacillus nitrificans TaxID=651560 RepID=UPI00285794DC|nr:hypothetical protein [Brevibacillus nitrificans]MDR7318943.1 hypothetical protein [Brevibacillus nitrificans]